MDEKLLNKIHSDLKFPHLEMFEKVERIVEEELLAVVKSFHGDVLESLKEVIMIVEVMVMMMIMVMTKLLVMVVMMIIIM